MPDFSELQEDVRERAKEVKYFITDFVKRQYRLRLTSACRVCNDLRLAGHEQTHPIGRLDLAYSKCKEAVKSGCQYCKFLCSVAEHYLPWVMERCQQGLAVDLKIMMQDFQSGFMGIGLGYKAALQLEVYLPEGGQLESWPTLKWSKTIAAHSDSDSCYQFVKDHIARHLEYGSSYNRAEQFPPKRLLDVGNVEGGSIKLVEGFDSPVQYIALSYCWGGFQPLKTQIATIEQRKQGISWDDLPQAFKDAVTVAKKLGIPYIWIDALCIVQDDQADWEVEASHMASYYEYAYLVIAASVSPNPSVPFLTARDPYWSSIDFPFLDKRGVTHTLKVRRLHRLRYMVYSALEHNLGKVYEHQFGPISGRAWTWQENTLAVRIIHYTSHGLLYECRGEQALYAEDIPHALPLDWIRSLPEGFAGLGGRSYSQWHELVKSYSARNLTFDKDKLPAIGGAAEKHAELQEHFSRVKQQYHAGLWERSFAYDLLWQADHWAVGRAGASYQPAPVLNSSGCPSWSWASLNGRVRFPEYDFDTTNSLVMLKEIVTYVPGLNPYGQCTGGFVRLSGPVVEASLSSTDSSISFGYQLRPEGTYTPQNWVGMDADTILENWMIHYESGETEETVRRAPTSDSGTFRVATENVYCLLVCESKKDEKIAVIVLAKSDTVPGAYMRIGQSGFSDIWKAAKQKQMTLTIV